MNASGGPAGQKISPSHLGRDAYVYIRKSTQAQVMMNTESLARQYELAERAGHLGWHPAQIVTIDADLGQSGARSDGRLGFNELVADVGLGKAGIVLGIEVSRLARNNALFRYRNKAFCSACRFMPRRKPKPWPRMEGAGVEAE